jgi:hypothetical protein
MPFHIGRFKPLAAMPVLLLAAQVSWAGSIALTCTERNASSTVRETVCEARAESNSSFPLSWNATSVASYTTQPDGTIVVRCLPDAPGSTPQSMCRVKGKVTVSSGEDTASLAVCPGQIVTCIAP